MSLQEALEEHIHELQELQAVNGKLAWSKENEKMVKEFVQNVFLDAGYMILAMLIGKMWKIEE